VALNKEDRSKGSVNQHPIRWMKKWQQGIFFLRMLKRNGLITA